jgi:glycosyltransferase involved in cell wall biosynthesis
MSSTRRRVVIDGLPLQVRSAGIAMYTAALVRALAQQQSDTEFVLFGLSDAGRTLLRAVPAQWDVGRFPANVSWTKSILYPAITGFPLPGPPLLPLELVAGKVDLYHATNYAVPRTRRAPVVVTVHDLTLLRQPELGTPALRRLVGRLRRSVSRAARVIADSEATRRDVIELLGVSPDKARVVHLGCDESFGPGDARESRARVAERFAIEAPYILHVGTIEPRKNLERLLEAFSRACVAAGTAHRLVLAGAQGWGYESVLAKIRTERLEDAVTLTGTVSPEDLVHLYRGADLFAYPSLYEGFGLPVVEAMACGTPVVTADVASLPEIAGDAALLVDPRDVAALADAIARGIGDSALRERLRADGLERARAFTWERCARETLAVYEEVLAAQRMR